MKEEEIINLRENHDSSVLYSADLAPVPKEKRTWNTWSLAALWVGMAVCIPTYLLASYMIKEGMGWLESLIIIGAANLIITIPMVLNGHAGVKYGIPFPVVGRASFGIKGIHIPSITRGIVACGWFGIQTWIGGLALYEILYAFSDSPIDRNLNFVKFLCFGIFWLLNMFFIWKGTKSIKWLEEFSAPILIGLGIALIVWGAFKAEGFGKVLASCEQLQKPSFTLSRTNILHINSLKDKDNKAKAEEFQLKSEKSTSKWMKIPENKNFQISSEYQNNNFTVRVRKEKYTSSWIVPVSSEITKKKDNKLWSYIKWLTIMLGFWATMSLSISDITRYAPSQKSQKRGQFIGLPGTMMLYSFVAIFVTCAAAMNFRDILVMNDATWDPTALLGKFKSPWVVIISQIFMIIATLSTNIAANVIAPSNAFSNLFPKKITFKQGGTITGIIGIIICPWWLMDDISNLMLFISGLLGPVLAIMLCDYFLIRNKNLDLDELYKVDGIYAYGKSGFNPSAMIALILGIVFALIWTLIPILSFLATLAWFSGFFVAFVTYYVLMTKSKHYKTNFNTHVNIN